MVVTLGELMLSPMGLSLVSKVAPISKRGLLMGGWFVATAPNYPSAPRQNRFTAPASG